MNTLEPVSVGILARVLGVTDRRIHQLVKDGVVPVRSRGLYDLDRVVPAYVAYLKSGSGEKVTAKSRRAEAEADLAEMERDERAGQLHKDSDIARVWGGILTAFRSRMSGLPTKAAPRVEGKDVARIEAELRAMVNEALSELSEHDPSRFHR